ncbi:MAG: hypothetical protein WAM79_08035 [Candidatus Sulfotelmatobacter sp.]
MKDLCDQIAKEQDHKRFSDLIAELNQLLDSANTPAGNPADGTLTPVNKNPS